MRQGDPPRTHYKRPQSTLYTDALEQASTPLSGQPAGGVVNTERDFTAPVISLGPAVVECALDVANGFASLCNLRLQNVWLPHYHSAPRYTE